MIKQLYLTLYREYFDAILNGTKRIEYRHRSFRYDRMFLKLYTHVKFVNGYGHHRPWLIAEIVQFKKTKNHWLIYLGTVIKSGNLSSMGLKNERTKTKAE